MRGMKTLCAILLMISYTCFAAEKINWRLNGFEPALAEATKAKKPLLVYWGAIWCPPCNTLKAKAFSDSEFVELTKSFIPVYLDGDSSDAQIWGEKLQASGYPTLLILDSSGQEIQRLVTSDSLANLISQLKASLKESVSLDDLLKKTDTGNAKLTTEDCKRLASHEWNNDTRWKDKAEALAAELGRLAASCPEDSKGERMTLKLMAMSVRAEGLEEKKAELPVADRAQWLAYLEGILDNPPEFRAHANTMVLSSEYFLKSIFPGQAEDSKRDRFIANYLNAVRGYRKGKDLSFEERVYSVYPFAELSRGENLAWPAISKSESESLKAELIGELDEAKGNQEKQVTVLNSLAFMFGSLGSAGEAEKIVLRELPSIHAKNEMMSNLADLEEKQSHKKAAMKWKHRAYLEAEGGPTRLQWGQVYIADLIAQEPKQSDKIQSDSRKIIQEAMTRSDSFYGRSWRSLERLAKSLRAWAEKQKIKTLKVLPTDIKCGELRVNASAKSRCESFMFSLAKN